ncbi:MAG: 50S ribosomal protein L23 [Bacilli bacterium]|nr:50S ribosomal protein L23 [Bacilli bacterium]MDD4282512.1 50S ribosomal protein L23 [Bacilli bacterium]MDD4718273.1 50S ribosomal protein L23 [Bacilli bacterium]
MSNYRDIIKAPIITEKSNDLVRDNNTYTFSVDTRANKVQIKQAVEKIFNVKVDSVNIINMKPKKKRVGRHIGKTNKIKKAMVKLSEGSSIELQ